MPINDNSCILLFFHRYSPVMVRVQKFLDFLLGFLPTIALKGFHIHSRGVLLAQARCELNLAMDRIIVRDETADEPNDYGRRLRGRLGRRDRMRGNALARRANGRGEEDKYDNRWKHPPESSRANQMR